MTTIKLKSPESLPAHGVTNAVFKPWKNQVVAFLQQEIVNFNFCKGGRYDKWLPYSTNNKRIGELAPTDKDKVEIERKREDNMDQQLDELLLSREAQLAKFLNHISSFCHYTEQDDVVNESTSLQWIWSYLESHYDIQTKGCHFLKIADLTPTDGVLPQVFYKQYRTAFIENLKTSGDKIMYKDKTLTRDEELSPSFECAIIMWALKEIDPRLPKKVRKSFEHRLSQPNVTLMDIQAPIFQAIPSMLEELDQTGDNCSVKASFPEQSSFQPSLAATTTGRYTSRNQWRRPPSQFGRSRGRGGMRGRGGARSPGNRFCQVCQLAGREERVFRSHDSGACNLVAAFKAVSIEEPGEDYAFDEEIEQEVEEHENYDQD